MEKTADLLCKKDQLIYTAFYCEENIWKFLESLSPENKETSYAIFISNENKSVAIWCQSQSKDIEIPVVWDYHVIAVHKTLTSSIVYDLDTKLDFPVDFKTYSEKSFPIKNKLKQYKPFFRVVSAKYYLENFASDRSHMIDKSTGKFIEQPPAYACIKSKISDNNLHEYISMSQNSQHGVIMSLEELLNFF